MSKRVLVIGCGQLGSRHLQAVASLKEAAQVFVVDPNPAALQLAQARLAEIKDLDPAIDFHWQTQWDPSLAQGDLCIVATQAQGRPDLIKEIVRQLSYRTFLIEKIVAQSVVEYRDLMDFCSLEGVRVWVNCKARAYKIHQYIKSFISPEDPVTFSAVGGNFGLATNGIHLADLFAFYDGATSIHCCVLQPDTKLMPSKRGGMVHDLCGTIMGFSDKGSLLSLSFCPDHDAPDILTIVTPRSRFMVDHVQKFAYESHEKENWVWKPVGINEDWRVSFMSQKFAQDILNFSRCDLPTLEECFAAHEFILSALLPAFNRLLKVERNFCPVT